VGKKASQAGQECISSKEMLLRLEDTLEEEPDERERLGVCETLSSLSRASSAISSNLRFNDIESDKS